MDKLSLKIVFEYKFWKRGKLVSDQKIGASTFFRVFRFIYLLHEYRKFKQKNVWAYSFELGVLPEKKNPCNATAKKRN